MMPRDTACMGLHLRQLRRMRPVNGLSSPLTSQAIWRHCRVRRQSAGTLGGALHAERVIVKRSGKDIQHILYQDYAGCVERDGLGCRQWFDSNDYSLKEICAHCVNTTILTRSPRFRWPRTAAASAACNCNSTRLSEWHFRL